MLYEACVLCVLISLPYEIMADKRLVLQSDTDIADQVAALSRNMSFLTQELSTLTVTLQSKDSEIAALQRENREKNATIASLGQELITLRQEVQLLNSNFTSKNSEILKLGQDLLSNNSTLSSHELAITSLQQKIQVATSDLTMDVDDIAALQQETGQMKSTLSALQSNLTTSTQVMQNAQLDLTSKYRNMSSAQQKMEADIAAVKTDIHQENATLVKIGQDLQGMNTNLSNQGQKLASVERVLGAKADTADLGSTYIRWGRTTCGGAGNSTQLMYKGYIGGAHYNQRGSGANMLCLPEHPSWAQYHSGNGAIGGRMYGVEYYSGFSSIFNPFGFTDYERAPCAVCRTQFSATTMVPGSTSCASGWTSQYTGYLMSGYFDQNAMSEYICVDGHPEETTVPNNGGEHGNLLYFVQVKCGTLPCQTFPDGRQLACTVCSK